MEKNLDRISATPEQITAEESEFVNQHLSVTDLDNKHTLGNKAFPGTLDEAIVLLCNA